MIILAGLCVILGVAPQTGLSLVTPVINELMPHLGSGAGHLSAVLPSLDVGWPVYVILAHDRRRRADLVPQGPREGRDGAPPPSCS